jgi:hypothetical protein
MKVGAWIHTAELGLDEQIEAAAECGLSAIRSYSLDYAEQAAPALKRTGLGLLGGLHVDSAGLVADWRSQVRLEELARYHELGARLEALCVGNELREGGDDPQTKRFTARLSFGLANVLDAYHAWLRAHGLETPLTYAMEGIVLDERGFFNEWLWPLVDACDVVGLNLYPMDNAAWFTYDAFKESRLFLLDERTRHDRLALFELHLRRVLKELERAGKPVLLTETGFPSAVGYHLEGDRLVVPRTDPAAYANAMQEFGRLLARVNADYGGRIQAAYFYEWRDNLYHAKIWNVEHSPIHTSFGLCDRSGSPKLDIHRLVDTIIRGIGRSSIPD